MSWNSLLDKGLFFPACSMLPMVPRQIACWGVFIQSVPFNFGVAVIVFIPCLVFNLTGAVRYAALIS